MDRLQFEYSDGGAENEAVPERSQGCAPMALANYTREPYRKCLSLLGGVDAFGTTYMADFNDACKSMGITCVWNQQSRGAGALSLSRAHAKFGDCIAIIGNDKKSGHITTIKDGLLLDTMDWQDLMEREHWWVLAVYKQTASAHPMGKGFVAPLL